MGVVGVPGGECFIHGWAQGQYCIGRLPWVHVLGEAGDGETRLGDGVLEEGGLAFVDAWSLDARSTRSVQELRHRECTTPSRSGSLKARALGCVWPGPAMAAPLNHGLSRRAMVRYTQRCLSVQIASGCSLMLLRRPRARQAH